MAEFQIRKEWTCLRRCSFRPHPIPSQYIPRIVPIGMSSTRPLDLPRPVLRRSLGVNEFLGGRSLRGPRCVTIERPVERPWKREKEDVHYGAGG